MSLQYWEYFLSIESDLEKCSRYIDFSSENYNTFSVELAKIIMTSSSEFDTVAKEICKLISAETNADNINDYFKIITSKYTNFCKFEAQIPRYGLSFKPWNGWTNSNSPTWWQAYNKIKHDRTNNFYKATLENALNSVSGLLGGILYFYDCKFNKILPDIDMFFAPRLFSIKNPNVVGFDSPDITWDYTLP